MTTENWIGVGAILATLLAPVVKFLLERKPTRRSKQESEERKLSPEPFGRRVINWFLFLIPSASLLVEFLSNDPVTRKTVFVVSASIASILAMVLIDFTHRIVTILERHDDLHKSHASMDHKLIDVLEQSKARTQKRRTGKR